MSWRHRSVNNLFLIINLMIKSYYSTVGENCFNLWRVSTGSNREKLTGMFQR